MQFKEHSTVLTSGGEKVGRLDRIVVDPENKDVTHLVVSKGMLLPHDGLVPIDDVERTPDEETIVLEEGAQPERFAEFVADRYTTTDPGGSAATPSLGGGPGFVLYPVPGIPPGYPGAVPVPDAETPAAPAARPTAELLEVGTKAVAVDGDKVGKVDEIVTLDDGSLDAIVVKSGILWFTRRRVVPVGWIREVSHDGIRLTVSKEQVMSEGDDPSTTIAIRPPGR